MGGFFWEGPSSQHPFKIIFIFLKNKRPFLGPKESLCVILILWGGMEKEREVLGEGEKGRGGYYE